MWKPTGLNRAANTCMNMVLPDQPLWINSVIDSCCYNDTVQAYMQLYYSIVQALLNKQLG